MNDHEFMLHPDQWPKTGLFQRIYLKRPSTDDLAQLAYYEERWGFCVESAPYEPDPKTMKWGGPELINEIIKNGWIVD